MSIFVQTIVGLFLIFGLWISMLLASLRTPKSAEWFNTILLMPIVSLILFGMSLLGILCYRVFNIRDCPEAAEELQKEIKEALTDLKSKGITLKQDSDKKDS